MEFDPNSTLKISVVTPTNNTTTVSEEHEIPVSPNIVTLSQPAASVSEPDVPGYNENLGEFSEVITEQPPQYHDLFPPEGDNEHDSNDSVAIVEQALSTAHINEANGLTLKYSGATCCPSLEIIPTLNQFPLALGAVGWKINGSSNDKCHCCCFWFPPISIGGTRKWQTMTLKQNEQEILSFMYRPMVCCCKGRKDRLVHIFIPQRNQRIAVLKQGNSFSDRAVLIDCVSKAVFVVKKLDVGGEFAPFAMTVLTNQGTPIAVASPTRGWRRRGFTTWTDFELKFNTNVPSNLLSVSSKSVVMVGFAMWAINYREENSRKKMFWILIGICAGILIAVFKIAYDSNSNSY